MPNIRLRKKSELSSFRKIALGTWSTAKDPQVYGSLTVRVDEALKYIERFREATGKRLTLTHLMAKVAGKVLEAMPDANAVLRWGRIYLREDIAIFFQVVMKDEETGEIDLSGVSVREPHAKSLAQIYDEFTARAEAVRKKKDKELEQTRSIFKRMPYIFLKLALNLISFFAYTLNLDLRFAGVPNDAFGSAMVTNIGSLGLQEAYVPVVPYSRVPLLVAMGAVEQTPLVDDDGKIVVAQTMKLCVTFDHRVLDGAHAAKMTQVVRECFADPWGCFDDLDALKSNAPPVAVA